MARLTANDLFKRLNNRAEKHWDSARRKMSYEKDREFFLWALKNLDGYKLESLGETLIKKWRFIPIQKPHFSFKDLKSLSKPLFKSTNTPEEIFFNITHPVFGRFDPFKIPVTRRSDNFSQQAFGVEAHLAFNLFYDKTALIVWADYFLSKLKPSQQGKGSNRKLEKYLKAMQDEDKKWMQEIRYRKTISFDETENEYFEDTHYKKDAFEKRVQESGIAGRKPFHLRADILRAVKKYLKANYSRVEIEKVLKNIPTNRRSFERAIANELAE